MIMLVECRASYYTAMLSVIWHLCSPPASDILAVPMQAPTEEARPSGVPNTDTSCTHHVPVL